MAPPNNKSLDNPGPSFWWLMSEIPIIKKHPALSTTPFERGSRSHGYTSGPFLRMSPDGFKDAKRYAVAGNADHNPHDLQIWVQCQTVGALQSIVHGSAVQYKLKSYLTKSYKQTDTNYVCMFVSCRMHVCLWRHVNLGCPETLVIPRFLDGCSLVPSRWFALYTWDGEIVWISMVSSVLQLMLQEPFKLPNRSLPHKFGAYGIVSSWVSSDSQ